MFDHSSFNEEHRFGSGGFANEADIERAGLLLGKGLPLGFVGERQLCLDADAPLISICGAGSGKTRDLLGYVMCGANIGPLMVLDPRGELSAISLHTLAPANVYGYYFNPMQMCSLPSHSCNLLDILDLSSPNFHADARFITEGIIPLPPGAKEPYFTLRARDWVEAILKARTEKNGSTSFPDLYDVINWIEGDGLAWADELEFMLCSRFPEVRRTAAEMLAKQQDSQREFGSILGEIYAHLSFLSDPTLRRSLQGDDFSVGDLVRADRTCRIHLNIPAEYLGLWSPIIRSFFTVAMLYKGRKPAARRVHLICDEAGQLGRFEALIRAFTYGRGAGIRTWALFQDTGQIIRNFEPSAIASFLGSAQVRQFFGVRDFQTAKLVSDMLGQQTLEYDDQRYQEEARRYRLQTLQNMFGGGDPFASAFEFEHYGHASQRKSKQARAVMSPNEILALPEDRQILFVSGQNIKPIIANKYPYFTRKEMAGRYLPNPYHPPSDRVKVMTHSGAAWASVIETPVPDYLSHFPQYSTGRALKIVEYPI